MIFLYFIIQTITIVVWLKIFPCTLYGKKYAGTDRIVLTHWFCRFYSKIVNLEFLIAFLFIRKITTLYIFDVLFYSFGHFIMQL